MNTDEDLTDFDRRARELIAELSKDGYPDGIPAAASQRQQSRQCSTIL
jgi:hypothetical protein